LSRRLTSTRLEKSRAQSILWLLEELKVSYELELFRRNKDTLLAPPELKKVHALGKSPVISITPAGSDKPIVLAETGFIAQYLGDHFGQGTTLVPKRYKDGQEGKVGGETEEWMRYQYFLHYNEGSFMPTLIIAMILGALKSTKIPFFVRPLTSLIANQLFAAVVFPNSKAHLEFLENQLETSGGDYLCGKNLTAADIVVSFGLITAKDNFKGFGKWEAPPEQLFPKVWAYIAMMDAQPGYKRSAEKIKEIDDSYGIKFTSP
jgi:glutathione S-transferase